GTPFFHIPCVRALVAQAFWSVLGKVTLEGKALPWFAATSIGMAEGGNTCPSKKFTEPSAEDGVCGFGRSSNRATGLTPATAVRPPLAWTISVSVGAARKWPPEISSPRRTVANSCIQTGSLALISGRYSLFATIVERAGQTPVAKATALTSVLQI